ncbi:Malonyl CoA-acyl carrier protein transacylase [Commensalibacter sp. Nvir]|uniref:ACP S-malonyltransferase n=1 Tax=Commensalibacter sp. Nvir TaxID=3069817 RepID=UPI002D46954A|nr:Malonyl CoA-acyl carrier protein transacylase [Commensalibacter sp. Nvir]
MTVRAFLFPGQGSQYVGMAKALCETFSAAREVLESLDETLKQPLSRLMMEGPEDKLTLTQNTQPALMAHSLAVMRVLERETGLDVAKSVQFAAGHSLGEYSALCTSKSFDFETTARLLRHRGEAMQSAVSEGMGGMAALLGTDKEHAKQICEEVTLPGSFVVVANDNGAGQVVISGHQDAIDRAIDVANQKKIKKAIKLVVSAPFHSPLMKPAAEKMQTALADIQVNCPVIPVVANVTAQPYQSEQDIKTLLVEQVTAPVRWAETIQYLLDQNVEVFYEIGSGKVLSNLVKRIAKDRKAYSISDPVDIDQFVKVF